ncbi:Uma2 family endonuclease [Acidisoma cellulosilytica]|uniref:Uma2 family endonuclease n=1 Tax=Acidisoma cellulosilyticum TaxID=2802395 RepID=A0A964E5U3_9PROT|nr:Uma2 family endonuclease [Acidisoma cellulosilyticum]MCB8882899.1 Uma2 family endonuclease [Acidisoma cellulosilyticum]
MAPGTHRAPGGEPSTQEDFFPWAQARDIGYEFDGCQPVAIPGWTVGHSLIGGNIAYALDKRLRGSPCQAFRLGVGVQTINKAVRYPDALVTCSQVDAAAYLVSAAGMVFEVVGPGSDHIDRIIKVREYAAVPSIRRYVIVESSSIGLMVLDRQSSDEVWKTTVLTADDILRMPEISIEIPVSEFYDGIDFTDQDNRQA